MEGKELRIGNWVNYKSEPIKCTMIGEYGIQSNSNDVLINAKFITPDIAPIPITQVILEKCGFEKTPDGCYLFSGVELYPYAIDYCFKYGEYVKIKKNLQYLHQLQNLFYALTGTELKIEM